MGKRLALPRIACVYRNYAAFAPILAILIVVFPTDVHGRERSPLIVMGKVRLKLHARYTLQR